MTSLYLGPDKSGVSWLFDPDSPRLGDLGRQADARTPDSPCDFRAVAADLDALPGLVADRHFGIATGVVTPAAAGAARELIERAAARVRAEQPATWGDALGELVGDLRRTVVDNHLLMAGTRQGRPPSAVGPAVETVEEHGVLCVVVRRFVGGPEDQRLLREWADRGAEDLQAERVLVDLRANAGGNDSFAYEWMEPAVTVGTTSPVSDEGWYVGETPLGVWNQATLMAAAIGEDQVPPWYLANRHKPGPGDVLRVVADPENEPFGRRPDRWPGRMLVLVDRFTRSSGESAAWALRHALGARMIGTRTAGMIEFGNMVPYLLPESGLHIALPTKHNNFGIPVERVGMPVDLEIDTSRPLSEIAADFDTLHAAA